MDRQVKTRWMGNMRHGEKQRDNNEGAGILANKEKSQNLRETSGESSRYCVTVERSIGVDEEQGRGGASSPGSPMVPCSVGFACAAPDARKLTSSS